MYPNGILRLLILHQLNTLDPTEGLEDPLEHLVADVAVQVAHVELHGSLLGSDHRVGVVTHAVLLGLARLHHDGNAKKLLT